MPTIVFTDAEMMVLNDALVMAPFGKIAPLIASINEQLGQKVRAPVFQPPPDDNRNATQ